MPERTDSERLDWLEKRLAGGWEVGVYTYDDPQNGVDFYLARPERREPDVAVEGGLIEAIDAAMEAEHDDT